jgi:hypothetical protein
LFNSNNNNTTTTTLNIALLVPPRPNPQALHLQLCEDLPKFVLLGEKFFCRVLDAYLGVRPVTSQLYANHLKPYFYHFAAEKYAAAAQRY